MQVRLKAEPEEIAEIETRKALRMYGAPHECEPWWRCYVGFAISEIYGWYLL
jgi:hypothetical protein